MFPMGFQYSLLWFGFCCQPLHVGQNATAHTAMKKNVAHVARWSLHLLPHFRKMDSVYYH